MSKRPSYRRPSKAQRRAALAEFLAGLPDPPELPEEAEASTTSEDGKLMHGTTWTLPGFDGDQADQVDDA